MEDTAYRAIAIVGAGAVLPDAKNVAVYRLEAADVALGDPDEAALWLRG